VVERKLFGKVFVLLSFEQVSSSLSECVQRYVANTYYCMLIRQDKGYLHFFIQTLHKFADILPLQTAEDLMELSIFCFKAEVCKGPHSSICSLII
jgi:hypothetical protein